MEKEKVLKFSKGSLTELKNDKESLVSWKDYEADHIFPHVRGG